MQLRMLTTFCLFFWVLLSLDVCTGAADYLLCVKWNIKVCSVTSLRLLWLN